MPRQRCWSLRGRAARLRLQKRGGDDREVDEVRNGGAGKDGNRNRGTGDHLARNRDVDLVETHAARRPTREENGTVNTSECHSDIRVGSSGEGFGAGRRVAIGEGRVDRSQASQKDNHRLTYFGGIFDGNWPKIGVRDGPGPEPILCRREYSRATEVSRDGDGVRKLTVVAHNDRRRGPPGRKGYLQVDLSRRDKQ